MLYGLYAGHRLLAKLSTSGATLGGVISSESVMLYTLDAQIYIGFY